MPSTSLVANQKITAAVAKNLIHVDVRSCVTLKARKFTVSWFKQQLRLFCADLLKYLSLVDNAFYVQKRVFTRQVMVLRQKNKTIK